MVQISKILYLNCIYNGDNDVAQCYGSCTSVGCHYQMTSRLITLLTIILVSCTTKSHTIDIRFNDNGIELIDTFSGQVTRTYSYGTQKRAFKLTSQESKTIYDYANSIGLSYIAIPSDEKACKGQDEITISFPTLTYELEFQIDGGQKARLAWGNNDCDNPTIKKVQSFSDSVKALILRKQELLDLEKSDIILL